MTLHPSRHPERARPGVDGAPDLSPLAAVRYTDAAGAPADLLAPPYDVIDPEEARGLRARSPWNAVRLVLPEGPAPDRYDLAARRLSEWLASGILARDDRPGLYVYRQSFGGEGAPTGEGGGLRPGARPGGRRHRTSFFAALRLSPFGEGRVLPHEETHGEPLEDRLALTLACRAQLSSVFLVAADPDGRLAELLERCREEARPLLAARTPDGVGHRLGRIPADALAWRLCEAAARRPLLIADGHHRYETALAVRERLTDRPAAAGVLACVTPESDPGLEVLPTHRALALEPPEGGWRTALEGRFRFGSPAAGGPAELAGRLSEGDGIMGLWEPAPADSADDARTGRGWLLHPRQGALEAAGIPPARRAVGSVLFDRLVLRETLGAGPEGLVSSGALSYHRDPDRAARAAGPAGAVFLLAPLGVSRIRRAVEGDDGPGSRLPPKTTYFAPKIPSGLLFRGL